MLVDNVTDVHANGRYHCTASPVKLGMFSDDCISMTTIASVYVVIV